MKKISLHSPYRAATPKLVSMTDALRAQLFSNLHLGILAPGERLASVRQLAAEYEVNPRVVLAAISDLQQEGLVEVRERSGAYVSTDAAGGAPLDGAWLAEVVTEAIQRGIPAFSLAGELRPLTPSKPLRVGVVECNDDQLYSVGEELGRDYGVVAVPLDVARLDDRRVVAKALRDVDLLMTTATHDRIVRKLAERFSLPVLTLEMCTDLYVGVGRLLPRQPVYFVISDPRFAKKLRRTFDSMAGSKNLRILVAGRHDIAKVPASAPMYVTRLTRSRLGEEAGISRIVPEPRIFSRQSAREIVSFLMSRNAGAPAHSGGTARFALTPEATTGITHPQC